MDELMRKEAVEILAAGAERTEEVKGQEGLWYAYMKPTRMGTWKNQASSSSYSNAIETN